MRPQSYARQARHPHPWVGACAQKGNAEQNIRGIRRPFRTASGNHKQNTNMNTQTPEPTNIHPNNNPTTESHSRNADKIRKEVLRITNAAKKIGDAHQKTGIKSTAEMRMVEFSASSLTQAFLYDYLRELSKDHPDSAVRAASRYVRLRDGIEHPEGSTDGRGRWYPSSDRELALIGRIRQPSAFYPWSYMQACRTLKHCCFLEGLTDRSEALPFARMFTSILDTAIDAPPSPLSSIKVQEGTEAMKMEAAS